MKLKSLPNELWYLIATFVPRKDLPALARVSSTLLATSHCTLYRRLILDNARDHVDLTCKMLNEHPTLARRVEVLELRTTIGYGSRHDAVEALADHEIAVNDETQVSVTVEGGEEGEEGEEGEGGEGEGEAPNTADAIIGKGDWKGDWTWIPLDSIKKMVRLRKLTLRGWPLAGLQTQKQLVDVVTRCCPKLREFRYEPSCLGYGVVGYPHQFEIKGLERFLWGGEPVLCGADLSLLKASSSTLTHLSYSGEVDVFDTAKLRHLADDFHFPNLIHLEFGSFFDTSDDFDIAEALTRFLVSHPTIQSLRLGWGQWHADFDPSAITKDFLPNLQSIDAHTTNVDTLARKGCTCLRNLSAMAIGSGEAEDAGFEIWDLLNSLKRIEGLPSLRRFSIRLGENATDDADAFVDWMEVFAATCPRVEVWEGDLPHHMSLHKILEVFTRFTHVREVRLKIWMVPEPSVPSKIDATRALASQCRLLERIYFDGEVGRVHLLTVKRGLHGEMESTSLEEVDSESDS